MFQKINDKILHTPRNTKQPENIESPPINSNLINDNQSDDSHIITVHCLDTFYTLSDTLILLNESIPDNNNCRTIETDGEQTPDARTWSILQNKNILNSGVHTRSMVAESPTGLFTPSSVTNTVLNITNSMRRGLN